METFAEKRKKIREKLKHFGRTAALGGLTFVSTVFGNGKTANAQTPVKDAQQNQTEAPAPKHVRSYGTSKDTINLSSMLSKDEMLLNQVVDELSDDPEFVANLLQERGLNTLDNFNLKGFEWTAEDIQDVVNDGPLSQKLKKNMYRVNASNKDGHHCAAAVFAGLGSIGSHCGVKYAYQAANVLAKDPNFVEINIKNNYDLLKNFDQYTVFVQDRNVNDSRVYAGHIGFVYMRGSVMGQNSGAAGPTKLPTSNQRNSSSYYGKGLRTFVPKDGHIKEALMVKLVDEGRSTIRIDSIVRVYLLENAQYAQRYGINVNNIKAAQKANKNGAEVIRTENNKKDVNEKADDAGTTYVAANQTVKKKAPRKTDIALKGKELSAYIRSTRNRV